MKYISTNTHLSGKARWVIVYGGSHKRLPRKLKKEIKKFNSLTGFNHEQ